MAYTAERKCDYPFTREHLQYYYWEKEMNTGKVAEVFGCSKGKILDLMYYYDIPLRANRNSSVIVTPCPPEQELQKLIDECTSTADIAKVYNVSSKIVNRWVQGYRIKRVNGGYNVRLGHYMPTIDKDTLYNLYVNEKHTAKAIAEMYGTGDNYILKLLNNYGIYRESYYSNHYKHYIANDGHRLRSYYELVVDNWLSDNNITHTCDKKILNTKYRYDFKIDDVYIEVWGMISKPKYVTRMQEKLRVYEQLGLQLISLYPKDFEKEKYKSILSDHLLNNIERNNK